MSNDSLIDQLRHAAAHVGEMSRDDLRALLQKAVERLSETEMDAEYLALIREMNEAGQEPFSVNEALRDWLISHGRLPFDPLDEDTETQGSA